MILDFNGAPLRPHAPNELQFVSLRLVAPSEQNVRLFIERESLDSLEEVYRAYHQNPFSVVLPDPPVVRYREGSATLELLAGHRRITAATSVGVPALPMRVVQMTDAEAYRFIRQANNYERLTTVERAFAVAEMDRLGFSRDEIREVIGNVAVDRYLRVGRNINPDWFSDLEKRCDPSITLWDYALSLGAPHLLHCFKQWDSGQWGEEECSRNFRWKGRVNGGETYESGARVTVDDTGTVLRFRGVIDLNLLTPEEIDDEVVAPFVKSLLSAVALSQVQGDFGGKRVLRFQPDALQE